MPGRDDPGKLRILKKSQLRVEIDLWRQTDEFLPWSRVVVDSSIGAEG